MSHKNCFDGVPNHDIGAKISHNLLWGRCIIMCHIDDHNNM